MRNRTSNPARGSASRAVPLGFSSRSILLAVALHAAPALAQRSAERVRPLDEASSDQPIRFIFTNESGDVHATRTINEGALHFYGDLGAATADYSYGAFDDIPVGGGLLAYPIDLAAAFELPSGQGKFDEMSIAFGSANVVAGETPPGLSPQAAAVTGVPRWYESDHFVSWATHIVGEWIGAVTYSIFTSPDAVSPTSRVVEVAARHTGGVSPQIKLVEPTGGEPGALYSVSIVPTRKLGDKAKLRFPVETGVGTDDYYGPATSSAEYANAGVTFSLALGGEAYGKWSLSVGADLVWRDDAIAALDPPFASPGDNTVWEGAVTVNFRY